MKKRDKKLMGVISGMVHGSCFILSKMVCIEPIWCDMCIDGYDAIIKRVIQMRPKKCNVSAESSWAGGYNDGIDDWTNRLRGKS